MLNFTITTRHESPEKLGLRPVWNINCWYQSIKQWDHFWRFNNIKITSIDSPPLFFSKSGKFKNFSICAHNLFFKYFYGFFDKQISLLNHSWWFFAICFFAFQPLWPWNEDHKNQWKTFFFQSSKFLTVSKAMLVFFAAKTVVKFFFTTLCCFFDL